MADTALDQGFEATDVQTAAVCGRPTPQTVFTDPQVASVGPTEVEATASELWLRLLEELPTHLRA